MCGRFTLTLPDFEQLARLLGVENDARMAARYRRRWNVAPTDAHWMVVSKPDSSQRELRPAKWGYGETRTILARAESVAVMPQFRNAFASGHRCVVPTDGFFEWAGEKGSRTPFWFHRPEGGLLLLAGVYEETAQGFDFALVTTAANEVVKPVHKRMPLVLEANDVDVWLRGDPTEARATLKHAVPPEVLVAQQVSNRVNSVKNDDEDCLAPPGPPSAKQEKLF